MKLYVCGPMTGRPQMNAPTFRRTAWALRSLGYEVFSPLELGIDVDKQAEIGWEGAVKKAVGLMVQADGVALLPEWLLSRGARLEVAVATQLAMPCQPVGFWMSTAPARVVPPPAC